AVPPRYGYTRG
nr:RecName: Full=68 kDa cell wall protein [Arabidopsis thaliana]